MWIRYLERVLHCCCITKTRRHKGFWLKGRVIYGELIKLCYGIYYVKFPLWVYVIINGRHLPQATPSKVPYNITGS